MGEVELRVRGQRWSGWREVRITAGLDRAARDFDIALNERWPGRETVWPIMGGDPCEVLIDGEPVLTGHVDDWETSIGPSEHRLRVAGRSRTADLVDCAALVPGGQFKGFDLAAIARRLCRDFGIGVEIVGGASSVGRPFADVQVQPGETVHELIERLCRLRGFLVSDTAAGLCQLAQAGHGSAPRGEALGPHNILSAHAPRSFAKRYSDYYVRGQQAGTDQSFGPSAAAVEAHVKDGAVTRHRPRLVIAEAQGDQAALTTRAKWERAFAAASGLTVSVTLPRWRQKDEALWQPGLLVRVDDERIGVAEDLIVRTVEYRKSDEGEYVSLTLVPPDVLTPEPESLKKDASGSTERSRIYGLIPIDG